MGLTLLSFSEVGRSLGEAGKRELEILLAAVRYFTRVPVPAWVGHSQAYLESATRYFPLIGAGVGAASYAVYAGAHRYLPISVSVVLAMLAGIWLTGAFHEDGLADACDGFGGGWDKTRILEIMKDSRIGAFGVIGLVLALLLKFALLSALAATGSQTLLLALVTAHAASRQSAVFMMFLIPYVRADAESKAKPIAEAPTWINLAVALASTMALLTLWQDWAMAWMLLPVAVTALLLGRYFKKWLGGYTGDCLGATQQVTELVLYMMILAV